MLECAHTVLVSKLVQATLASADVPNVTLIYGGGVSLGSFYGGQSVLFYLIISVGVRIDLFGMVFLLREPFRPTCARRGIARVCHLSGSL